MGKQQTASASGGQSSSGASSESSANPRENTARVVMRGSELPGWFWGLLGCLSVLGIGSAVLFLIFKPPSGIAAAAPSLAATAVPADRAPAQHGPQIDIEPMAPPPAPSSAAFGAPRPKAVPHPLKIARSPSAPSHPAAVPAGDTDKGADNGPEAETSDSDDAPKVKAKVKAKPPAADSDDDQAAGAHKAAPSDDKSDDKELQKDL
jgi:hypothetical protein